MHLFCNQKVATIPGVCLYIGLVHDASRSHRRGRGDNSKNSFFACHHEAYSALRTIRMLRNCVGELGMDTR